MFKRLFWFLLALLVASPAYAAEFSGATKFSPLGSKTVFTIHNRRAGGDYTEAIPSCPSMRMTWSRGAAAVVLVFATRPEDDTPAEIVAATLVDSFSVDEVVEIPQTSHEFRAWIGTPESSSDPSYLTVTCGTNIGGSSGGAPLTEYAALSSIDETTVSHVTVSDCDDLTCAAPGTGTTDVPFYYNGSAWVPFPGAAAGIASVSADGAPVLGGDLDADGNAIDNVERIGARKFIVNTQAELDAALTAIGQGVGTSDAQRGGTIELEGGLFTIPSAQALSGATAGTGGRAGLVIRGAGPGGRSNEWGYANGGTVLRWGGADGGSVLQLGALSGLVIENLAIDAKSCIDRYGSGGPPQTTGSPDGNCDTDGTTPQTVADHGLEILSTSGGPLKFNLRNVALYDFDDFAIEGNTGTGQWDESTIENVSIINSNGCASVRHAQSIQVLFGPNVICTLATDATNPGYLFDAGDPELSNSYTGLTAASQTAIQIGAVNGVKITNNHIEMGSHANAEAIIRDNVVNGQNSSILIQGNKIAFNASTQTAVSIAGRGHVAFRDNRVNQQAAGTDLTQPVVSFSVFTGSSANRLYLAYQNNWLNAAQTSTVNVPRLLAPSIGAGVYADPGMIATATLPSTADTDCVDGTIGVDIDDGSLKVCEADAWIDPPNLAGGGGTGTLTISGNDISSNGDVTVGLDQDANGTNSFTVRNGGDTTIFTVNESGIGSMSGALSSPSVVGTSSVQSPSLRAGVAGSETGAIQLWYGGAVAGTVLNPNTSGVVAYTMPSDDGDAGEQLQTNGSGVLSWEAAGSGGSGIFDTSGAFAVSAEDLILGGDADNTCEAGEVCIENGVVTADSYTARPTGIPLSTYKDSDTPDGDVNTQIWTNCGAYDLGSGSAASGAEDCDMIFSQQEAGTLRPFLVADADDELELGNSGVNRVVITTDGTGDAELVVPAGSISGAEVGTLVAGNVPSNFIDAIGEIATGIKSGSDGTLITGTEGTSGNCAEWDANGDLVDSGDVCGGGGGLAAGSQLDARRTNPLLIEEFTGPSQTSGGGNAESTWGWLDYLAITGGTQSTTGDASLQDHPGIARISSGSGALSGGTFYTHFTGGENSAIELAGGEIYETIFQPKLATGAVHRFGFHDSVAATDADDGVYFEAVDDLAFDCVSNNNGTRTTTAVATLTVDTWYRARVTVNSDKTSVVCQIWNAAGASQGSATMTTNLPAADNAVGANFVVTETAATAAAVLTWVDFIGVEFSGRALTR